MRREKKIEIIESLSAQIKENPNFYITDIAGLDAEDTAMLRRECFEKNIKITVVKNSLFNIVIKQTENEDMQQLLPTLKGNTAIMFTETANAPAKLIKKLRKSGMEKPELKGAFIQECVFVGADKLEELTTIKSKEEIIGDVISLLQSPVRNVISALQSAGGTIAGLVKTLSEKEEN